MKHLKEAKGYLINEEPFIASTIQSFLTVNGNHLAIDIQNGPIKEAGVNGIQALDLIRYTKCLIESLNNDFPCRENSLTITKLEEAIMWQDKRTKDRFNRGVEGTNQA